MPLVGKSNVILSYFDSIIYHSDLELLCGPYWLNDTVIGFYMEYLEREKFNVSDVSFIRPEVLQCIKFSDVCEFDIFLGPLKFQEKQFSVMPLNDCDFPDIPGGSHWSLLIFSYSEKSFFHVDSSEGSNFSHGKRIVDKLNQYLGSNFNLQKIPSSQQTNSYDCGVYVLCNLEQVLEHIEKYGQVSGVNLRQGYLVSEKRNKLKQLIEFLAH